MHKEAIVLSNAVAFCRFACMYQFSCYLVVQHIFLHQWANLLEMIESIPIVASLVLALFY